MVKRLTHFLAILGMASVALVPIKASAGWGWWGGPGISIYVGPATAIRVADITDTAMGLIGTMVILMGITDTGTGPMVITAIATTGTETGRATPIAGGTNWRRFLQR